MAGRPRFLIVGEYVTRVRKEPQANMHDLHSYLKELNEEENMYRCKNAGEKRSYKFRPSTHR